LHRIGFSVGALMRQRGEQTLEVRPNLELRTLSRAGIQIQHRINDAAGPQAAKKAKRKARRVLCVDVPRRKSKHDRRGTRTPACGSAAECRESSNRGEGPQRDRLIFFYRKIIRVAAYRGQAAAGVDAGRRALGGVRPWGLSAVSSHGL
jgi:hypothetical protein